MPSAARDSRPPDDKTFLLLLVAVSLAFAWIVWPLSGAVLWAIIAAIMFAPLYGRLSRSMGRRRSLAALVTLMIVVVLVILPLTLITTSLLSEATGVHDRIKSGELDLRRSFQRMVEALPAWAAQPLRRFELSTFDEVQARLSAGLLQGSQFIAARAISIGQSTLHVIVSLFVMLYLLFFLLRDGDALRVRLEEAIPLSDDHQRALFETFTSVIRALVKGNAVVACVQGALGGLIFWLLDIRAALFWGAVMAFLSLLPAVGPALVWLPVALFFIITGAAWQGVVLIAYGVVVIGLVDNVLRPMLVGKGTKIPDCVVLVSTLGGIAVFGFNGVVIGPVIAAMFIAAWDIFAASRPHTQLDRRGP